MAMQLLLFVDISEVSIQRCKERYESRKMYYRGGKHAFDAQFIVGDCCEVSLYTHVQLHRMLIVMII